MGEARRRKIAGDPPRGEKRQRERRSSRRLVPDWYIPPGELQAGMLTAMSMIYLTKMRKRRKENDQ